MTWICQVVLTLIFRLSPVNVFAGIHKNPIFCGILVVTMVLQVLIVEFGSVAFRVSEGGLDGKFWALSFGIGLGSLPVQQVINVIFKLGQSYKGYRMKRRLQRNASLSTRHTDDNEFGGHAHAD